MRASRRVLSAAVQPAGAAGVQSFVLNSTNGVASISVAIKGGSRYEQSPGVSHLLQAARSCTSASHTSFLQIHQLRQAGAQFTCDNTRDHLVYTLKAGPKLISELFTDVVAPAIFKNENWQWEITRLERFMKNQAPTGDDALIDQLHSVSFSDGGLEKSKFVPSYRLGTGENFKPDAHDSTVIYMPKPTAGDDPRIQSDEVFGHLENVLKSGNVSVYTAGMGEIEAAECINVVNGLCPAGSGISAPASAFVAGESRIGALGSARAMIGFPGAQAGSKDAVAYAAVAQMFGGHSFNYEGAGLVAIPSNNISATLASMANASAEKIEAGVAAGNAAHALAGGPVSGQLNQHMTGTVGAQTTSADVSAALKNMLSGLKSLVVKGELEGVPFLSQINSGAAAQQQSAKISA